LKLKKPCQHHGSAARHLGRRRLKQIPSSFGHSTILRSEANSSPARRHQHRTAGTVGLTNATVVARSWQFHRLGGGHQRLEGFGRLGTLTMPSARKAPSLFANSVG